MRCSVILLCPISIKEWQGLFHLSGHRLEQGWYRAHKMAGWEDAEAEYRPRVCHGPAHIWTLELEKDVDLFVFYRAVSHLTNEEHHKV